jgi:DNA/RNA endonuclease G (NUC1)
MCCGQCPPYVSVDVNLNKLGVDGRFTDQPGTYTPNTAIYDRLGESDIASFFGNNSILLPPFKREGNGEGWYYSVLGGGKSARQYTGTRVPVSWDNTLQARSRGDFAVPTLFNGNFDAEYENPSPLSSRFVISNAIAGWSFRNNETGATWASNVVNNGYLKDWKDIPTFADSNGYLSKLGIDPTAATYQPNYAIELNSSRNTITHNRFLVPDWGALRFDLFTGDVDKGVSRGQLKVFLDEAGSTNTNPFQIIELQEAEATWGVQAAADYNADRWRIGYGEVGFETFMIDVPDVLRGKVGTLRFELTGGGAVYLDNVFFKSQHLLLGNLTEARHPNSAGSYISNYLLEKPQFTVSYNENTKVPNWVAWQLNKSWLGSESKRPDFFADPALANDFTAISHNDYLSSINPDRADYDRGHLAPSAHRKRDLKDNIATFLTTNILPQSIDNNRLFFVPDFGSSAWYKLESYAEKLARQGKEIYEFAGGLGHNPNPQLKSNGYPQFRGIDTDPTRLNEKGIYIPEWTWKTMLVLDRPTSYIGDITPNTTSYTIITPNTAEPLPSAFDNGQTIPHPLNQILANQRPNIASLNEWRAWETWRVTLRELEDVLPTEQGFNFLANVSIDIRNVIKEALSPVLPVSNSGTQPVELGDTGGEGDDLTASLLANDTMSLTMPFPFINGSIGNPTIWQSGIAESHFHKVLSSEEVFGSREIDISQISTPTSISQVSSTEVAANEFGITQIGLGQIGIAQIGIAQIGTTQLATVQIGTAQISTPQISLIQHDTIQIGFTQIGSTQIDPAEISLPSSITLQQLLSSHNPNLQNTTVPTWTEFLQSPTPFNLKIEVTDLPTGQLAEATITGYDTNNRPNSGTLTLDTDGNSLGWFIDTTPEDNTEFTAQLADTAYKATADSAAYGKYDLLTTILHELGHLNGIIRGNTAFDTHVQNINGIPTFINGGITAQLTPDGSHLDTTFHPYDLMNTSLKPGVRKLPSALNLAMIEAINAGVANGMFGVATVNPAHLTAGALIGITNGDFTTPTTWNTAGATNLINGTATLTEQSQKLSELTQAFIIPTGAKTLQFTIKDNHLIPGDTTKTANDAFEVALLDTNTFTPLAGTSIGLNHTDSLLNIQANGTIHKSDKVTITALGNNSSIVSIDLTQVAPTTQATLYFNLLGFGAKTSTVTIDDVKLFTDTQPIPVTNNDTLIVNQNTPLTLDPTQLTTNDTNVAQIQVINQPTHGTLTQTPDGKLTYQPVSTYVGNDSFTYLGFGSDGQISNLATVNLTINNLPPTIQRIDIPTNIKEGTITTLTATATDIGNDPLTYRWYINGATTALEGRSIDYTFTDNGNYPVKLEVLDNHGGIATQTVNVTVNNVAPTIGNVTAPTNLTEGSSAQFSATATDPGILDTLTYSWNFGDGTDALSGQNVSK